MDKIIVTGGSGQVGKHLKEIMPYAIYLSSKDYDLTSENEVKNMFEKHKPKKLIHLASFVGGIESNILKPAEYFSKNVLMNTLLVDYSHKNNVDVFIGMLSTCIYPNKVEIYPLKEEDLHKGPPTQTNFSYGYAKRCMAVQIDSYNKQYNTKYQYLTPCNLYSEHDKYDDESSHYVASLIKKIYKAKTYGENKITLMGSGNPIRQFMYSGDLARIIKYFIENNIIENVNVSTTETYTIKQIAEIALKSCDAEHLLIEFDQSKPDGQYRKDVSNEKLLSIIPNFEFTSLEYGIRKTYNRAIELNRF